VPQGVAEKAPFVGPVITALNYKDIIDSSRRINEGNATEGDWHYFLHTAGATWKTAFGTTKQHTFSRAAWGS
jgi:hypothetical protein